LAENRIHGPIPDVFGNMVRLQIIALGYNALTGRLPDSIGGLSQLQTLDILNNQLTGPIPTSYSGLTSLRMLSLKINMLTGPVPAFIGSLSQLTYILLSYNRFTGTLPVELAQLPLIHKIVLNNNHLHGHIPVEYGAMSTLAFMYIGYNKLSGPVPLELAQLPLLTDFYVDDNILSGPIDFIVSLTNAEQIDLTNNRFTGTIPDGIGELALLNILLLQNNLLHGTIPASLAALTQLTYVYMNQNQLTGTVPDLVASAAQLQYLYVSDNLLTGTVPVNIGTLSSLLELDLGNNDLTGRVPESITGLTQVQVVDLSNNNLQHTLPIALHNLTNMVTLNLQGNNLKGSLDSIFSTAQLHLTTIQLDNNQFTGTIPDVIFDLPSLVTVTMVGSCIHGKLPSNICSATKLEALILYGLNTGSDCTHNAITTTKSFGGTLPACLLQLPELRTLLLSGNGLTGTIADTFIPPRLLELDLSHNRLSGSIPHSVQNHTWYLLDLAHNKLNGVLNGALCAQQNLSLHLNMTLIDLLPDKVIDAWKAKNKTLPSLSPSLSLTSNRLSGRIPNSVKRLQDITILAGNLFECSYSKTDLPEHDDGNDNYECASNTFNVSIYVWLGLVMLGGCIVAVMYWYKWHVRYIPADIPDAHMSHISNVIDVFDAMYTVLKCTAWCTLFVLCVMLPFYGIVSRFEGTHTHQYAYLISGIYNSGVVPFVCNTILLIVLMWIMYYTLHTTSKDTTTLYNTCSTLWFSTICSDRNLVWLLYIATNVSVVAGVNIAFVYVVLYESSAVQTAAQVLLSLFKLVWNVWVSPLLLRHLAVRFMQKAPTEVVHATLPPPLDIHSNTIEVSDVEIEVSSEEPFFLLELLVALFNNIAIPCLVVAAIDPNCFSTALQPAESKSVDYLLPVCQKKFQGAQCLSTKFQPATLHFNPPFTYSYQCSASFITSYAPTFVYMSISTVFLLPLLQFVLLRTHQHLPEGGIVRVIVGHLLPNILCPLPPHVVPRAADYTLRPLFGAVGVFINLLTQLGILLTFGAIFPPVALAMAVSIGANVYMTRFKVQRFICAAVNIQQYEYLNIINTECASVGTKEHLQLSWQVLLCACSAFYMLFLFDTLGDAEGFKASAWVLFVVSLAPYILYIGVVMYGSCVYKRDESVSEYLYQPLMGVGADSGTVDTKGGLSNVVHYKSTSASYEGGSVMNAVHTKV